MIWLRAARHIGKPEVRATWIEIGRSQMRSLAMSVEMLIIAIKIVIWRTMLFILTGRLS